MTGPDQAAGPPLHPRPSKTDALFAREQEARTRDETDLKWLAGVWSPFPSFEPTARRTR